MIVQIDVLNFSLGKSEITDSISFWVNGSILINQESFEIQGSIDEWEEFEQLNLLLGLKITEKDVEENKNECQNIFYSEYKQWLFNAQLSNKKTEESINLFIGDYFNPESGDSIKNCFSKFSKLVNAKESILKSIIIENFIFFLNGHKLKKEYYFDKF